MNETDLPSLLSRRDVVLLDGAVGTELARRGIATTLPLWSARALVTDRGLATLREIHGAYARAGAEILVTNTFRTTLRALTAAGRAAEWRAINWRAVECARAGAGLSEGPCLVAGGIAPLEDCYSPELAPSASICLEEHRRQTELLAALGVDLLFVETMNAKREAVAAVRAAAESGLDVLASFCPATPNHLISGEPLEEVVSEVVEVGGPTLRGILINCASPDVLGRVFPRFAAMAPALPHGLYAHLGEPDGVDGWRLPERHEPERYAEWMAGRMEEGARLLGGCCGTTPDHIASLALRIRSRRT